MSDKKIYLIRHGQTDYNLKGIVQGSGVDTSINATGVKQAEAFYAKYKHVPFKKIYTSSLRRTVESVSRFIDSGIPHEAYPGLNEISWGEKDGKIVNVCDHNHYSAILESWKRGEVTRCIDGGESPQDVYDRQRPVIDLIFSRPEEDIILICMHGRAMRILLAALVHCNLKLMDTFEHQNLCLYVLCSSENYITVEKCNDVEHLNRL